MTHEEAVVATREWFAENSRRCIADARSGRSRVNDLGRCIAWHEEAIRAVLAGESDHTLAFQQRCHFIQAGECAPLLPRAAA